MQEPKIKLQIVTFLEFGSYFVGNPVFEDNWNFLNVVFN